MPNLQYLYAADFMKVLQEKHASNTYAKMVRFFLVTYLWKSLLGWNKQYICAGYICRSV